MKNTLGGQFLLIAGMSRRPNEGLARHSSEALNVQVIPRSVLGSEELKWRKQANALLDRFSRSQLDRYR